MDKLIQPSAQLFDIGNYLFEKALDGLDDDDVRKQAGEQSSSMIWIAGHVTSSRCGLLGILGGGAETPWSDRFGRGSQSGDEQDFPPLEEVQAKWNEVSGALMQRLEELTGEELSQKSPRDFPVPDKTLRGAINFLAYHEAYHMGQMGYLRKWLGKGSLVG